MRRLRGVSIELLAGIIILTLLTITVISLFILGYTNNIAYNVARDIGNSVQGLIE